MAQRSLRIPKNPKESQRILQGSQRLSKGWTSQKFKNESQRIIHLNNFFSNLNYPGWIPEDPKESLKDPKESLKDPNDSERAERNIPKFQKESQHIFNLNNFFSDLNDPGWIPKDPKESLKDPNDSRRADKNIPKWKNLNHPERSQRIPITSTLDPTVKKSQKILKNPERSLQSKPQI